MTGVASLDAAEERRIIEALILASSEPIPAARIAAVVPECSAARVRARVAELNGEYEAQGRAFEIHEVAGGFQLRTRVELAGFVQQLRHDRPLRLSQAALETLAIIAYKQPVTRAEVEHVRGVECGPILRSLLERRLVRVAGHREVPGRPILYGTTKRFLEVFGLASLDDLPTLRELEELLRARAGSEEGGDEPDETSSVEESVDPAGEVPADTAGASDAS